MAFLIKSRPLRVGMTHLLFLKPCFSETLLKLPISSLAERRKSEETCRNPIMGLW
jgi:hypothetical protein